jgi:hypothetical protein
MVIITCQYIIFSSKREEDEFCFMYIEGQTTVLLMMIVNWHFFVTVILKIYLKQQTAAV